MEQYNEILKLKAMTRKRYMKLLMGRDRFSRNLARTLAGSVQVRQKFVEKLNHIAKNRCGEPLYISAIDYENPELRIEEIRNRLRRRKICEKL